MYFAEEYVISKKIRLEKLDCREVVQSLVVQKCHLPWWMAFQVLVSQP